MFNMSDIEQFTRFAQQIKPNQAGQSCLTVRGVAELSGVESAHLVNLLGTKKFISYLQAQRCKTQEASAVMSKFFRQSAANIATETPLSWLQINADTPVEAEDVGAILGYYAEEELSYKALESLVSICRVAAGLPMPTKEDIEGKFAALSKAKRKPLSNPLGKRDIALPEAQAKARLLSKIKGAKVEVSTPYGRIDILTPTEIIEVKRADKWKDAIGQIQAYSMAYPNHRKVIHLFGPTDKKSDIVYACSLMDIEVVFDETR